MDGFAWLVVIGIAIWLLSSSGSSSGRSSNTPTRSSDVYPNARTSVPTASRSVSRVSGPSNVIKDGFQPDDRCSCGGTWVKRENRDTGGRFFSCSRYPNCKNSREQVLKARLGSQYSEIYCSHGHHKPTSGTVYDFRRGKDVCKKCVEKGYLILRSPASSQSHTEPKVDAPTSAGKKKPTGTSRGQVEKCRNGHPRTKENTYIRPDGSRECRICKRNSR